MKFIVDTQLPPRLAKFLTEAGYDTIHTTHFPNGHLLDDATIRKIAIQDQRIIISKDSDFFDRYLIKGVPPYILLIRFGNISNNDLLTLFQSQLAAIEQLFEKDGAELVEFYKDRIVRFQV